MFPGAADEKVPDEEAQPGGQDPGDALQSPAFPTENACAEEQDASPETAGAHVQGMPGAYTLRAVLMAGLGYAYVCGVLSGLCLLLFRAVSFIVKSPDPLAFLIVSTPFLILVLALLYGTLRTVWIRTPVPEGFEMTPSDSPWLFGTLDLIRIELEGPRIHKVLLTSDFNAFIARIPRLGIFGWHRNCLVLGLPLLQALSTRQMLAVLAHEYGHLPGGHGRLNSWLYGVRKSWMQIQERLEGRRGFGTILLAWFFRWYAPCFQASTTLLARAHEYGADQCSAAIAGRDETAAALMRFEVLHRYLHESFWPEMSALMDIIPEPVPSVYGLMQEKLAQEPDRKQGQEWLEMSLSKAADPEGTHPCLSERLEAIGEIPVLPAPPARSAAQYYFPDLDQVRARLDEEWTGLVAPKWRERHEHVRDARARLSELVAKARVSPLSAGETLEIANLTEDLSGRDEAFPFYQRILEYMPRFVPALCAVGRISLAKGDESGVGFIERAIALDPGYRIYGLEALYNFYMGRGDREKSGEYFQRLYEQREVQKRAGKSGRMHRLPARYMVSRKRGIVAEASDSHMQAALD